MDDEGQKQTVAYILAASHSGSTLLALLLDSHPEVCSVGELKVGVLGDLDSYLCSCRRRLLDCPFWTQLRGQLLESGEAFSFTEPGTDIRVTDSRPLKTLLRPMVKGRFLEVVRDCLLRVVPGWMPHYRRVRRRNFVFLTALARLTDAKVVADSSKVGVRLKYLADDPKLDVRVVNLVRDGRGVALTYINPNEFADAKDAKLRGGGSGRQDDHRAMSMSDAASEWVRANEEAANLRNRLGDDTFLEIRYEDLCTNTIETLNAVYRFLGVSPLAEEVLSRVDSIEHHIVGNGMRLDDNHSIVLDERWKTSLSPEQKDEFQAVAGQMSAALGYD